MIDELIFDSIEFHNYTPSHFGMIGWWYHVRVYIAHNAGNLRRWFWEMWQK